VTNVSGTTNVSGVTNVSGTTNVSGVTNVSGTTNISGSTNVSGTTNISGATNISGTTNVSGTTSFSGSVSVSGTSAVSGLSSVSGTLSVDGLATIDGNLDIDTATGDTLDFNDTGLNVTTNGGGALQVEDTDIRLTTSSGGGITSNAAGETTVAGSTSTQIMGGGNQLLLDANGATCSDLGGTNPITVTGVADGVNPFDAVNKRQLDAAISEMRGGVATAIAMTHLPTPQNGATSSFGIGLGHFNGESAVAIGGTALLENGVTLKGSVGANTATNDLSIGLGIGVSLGR
jgi:hypothetical protein